MTRDRLADIHSGIVDIHILEVLVEGLSLTRIRWERECLQLIAAGDQPARLKAKANNAS